MPHLTKVLRDAFSAAVRFTDASWIPTEPAEVDATDATWGNLENAETCHTLAPYPSEILPEVFFTDAPMTQAASLNIL